MTDTIKKIKVWNMESPRGGTVPNQFEISTPEGRYFQSYNSIIAFVCGDKVTLDSDKWDYSRTTGKYRNQFLGEDKADTLKKIKSGVYKLANLN